MQGCHINLIADGNFFFFANCILSNFISILAQSRTDAEQYTNLTKILVLNFGNVKYASSIKNFETSDFEYLRQQINGSNVCSQ